MIEDEDEDENQGEGSAWCAAEDVHGTRMNRTVPERYGFASPQPQRSLKRRLAFWPAFGHHVAI